MGSSLALEWTTDFATEYILLYANDGNSNHYEVVLGLWTVLEPLPARTRLIDGIDR